MTKITDLKTGREQSFAPPFIAALGDFDGVHLGHRAVLAEARRLADRSGVACAAWSFERSFKTGIGLLTDKDEKERQFAACGVDCSITEEFESVKDLSPEEFVASYLTDLGCRGVVCGFNFRFGKDAAGDVGTLSALCKKHGIAFSEAEPVSVGGEAVSSSAIRAAIAEGDVETAASMLGRPYSVRSEVTHGRTLGKTFGYPTINQNFKPGCVTPRHGVYYTCTKIGGRTYPSVSNVGSRPTVGGHVCRLETHIIGFEGDLYGQTPEVCFLKFRRPEEKFGDEEELVRAISKDLDGAKEFFSQSGFFEKNQTEDGK